MASIPFCVHSCIQLKQLRATVPLPLLHAIQSATLLSLFLTHEVRVCVQVFQADAALSDPAGRLHVFVFQQVCPEVDSVDVASEASL